MLVDTLAVMSEEELKMAADDELALFSGDNHSNTNEKPFIVIFAQHQKFIALLMSVPQQ